MTEGKDSRAPDVLARQAILGGRKVPFLLGFPHGKLLHLEAEVDVAERGSFMAGIPKAFTEDDLNNITWAARWISCSSEIRKSFCKRHEYTGLCWIPRPDGFTPPTP